MTKYAIVWALAASTLVQLWSSVPAYSQEERRPAEGPRIVSLVRLIATPDEFDGLRIVTFGYGEFRLEESILYLSEGDAQAGILANAIWVSASDEEAVRSLSGRYIEAEGIFDAKAVHGIRWEHFAGVLQGAEVRALPGVPRTRDE